MGIKKSMAYPLAFCLFLSSCSSMKPHEYSSIREPSSTEMSEENFQASFITMMNSQEPEKEFLGNLELLKNIFVSAEAGLADYDKELEEATSTSNNTSYENSRSYKKMIVIWGLSHKLQDKMIYHYLALSEMSHDKSLSSSKRKIAKEMIFKFNKKLKTKEALEQMSFDELKGNLASVLKERSGMMNKSFSDLEIPPSSFTDDQEKIKILRDNRAIFQKLGKQSQINNDELNQKIESESDQLQLVDQKGREPQQADLKFYPSVGPNGNVMGLIFPKNVWALTYDDGPHPVHTPKIVKNLQDLGIKATFFWLAENIIPNQKIVDLVRSVGLPTENHSWSHAELPKVSQAKLNKEIVLSTDVDTKAYGEKPKFFRCPYGAGNSVPRIRKMISDLGMIHVFWNVDTLDWHDKDPDSILARAKKQMKAAGHGVILFHDIHPQSVIASKKLVEWSKTLKGTDQEIRWVTIPEIIDELNGAGK